MKLTPRDLDLIQTLASAVRILTLIQIAAAWWNGSSSGYKNARQRVSLLTNAGLLQQSRVLARPLLPLSMPEAAWQLGRRPAHFGELSWRLSARWALHPQRTTVYCVTRHSLETFGGRTPGRIKNLCQVTHDLHLGTVYLIYRSRWPSEARDWRGEDSLPDGCQTQKVPDALLVNSRGEPYRVVEFGGSYSARRLSAIHAHWSQLGIPYEIW